MSNVRENAIYRDIEGVIASIASMNSEVLDSRNSLDVFAQTLEINDRRRERLSSYRRRLTKRGLIVLNELENFSCLSDTIGIDNVVVISLDEFVRGKLSQDGMPVLLTNNQVCSLVRQVGFLGVAECRNLWDRSLWLVHDYDNHHWYEMSSVCELFADFYFPAHPFVGSRLIPFLASFKAYVPIGSNQWKRSFIRENSDRILNQERSDEPLGMHNFYPKFVLRNRIIKTLSVHMKDVRLIDVKNYHAQSDVERFHQWVTRKCHFIVPVENDLPIRFFDSIITGGIPIIPKSLTPALDYYNIPSDFYVTYSLDNIFNPELLISQAISKFNNHGQVGIQRRMSYALGECHIDHSVEKIMNLILEG